MTPTVSPPLRQTAFRTGLIERHGLAHLFG
jgi:hypothetical protein